jgi:hypothetical protein
MIMREDTLEPIKKFDRPTSEKFSDEVKAALKSLSEQLGVSVRLAGGRISPTKLTLNLDFTPMQSSAELKEAEKAEFDSMCWKYLLKSEAYGQRFTSRGVEYEIRGFAPSRRKYPIRTVRVSDGATVFHTVTGLKLARPDLINNIPLRV